VASNHKCKIFCPPSFASQGAWGKGSRFGFPQKSPQDGSKPIEERGWNQEINKIKMSGEII
jgi:hypothetical protein